MLKPQLGVISVAGVKEKEPEQKGQKGKEAYCCLMEDAKWIGRQHSKGVWRGNSADLLVKTAENVLSALLKLLAAHKAFAALRGADQKTHYISGLDKQGRAADIHEFNLETRLLRESIVSRRPMIHPKIGDSTNDFACAVLPLFIENDWVGFLYVQDGRLSPQVCRKMNAFALQAAASLRNAQYRLLLEERSAARNNDEETLQHNLCEIRAEAAACVAHEINNIVAAADAHIELAEEMTGRQNEIQAIKQHLEKAKTLLLRTKRFTDRLMGRTLQDSDRELISLNDVICESLDFTQAFFRKKGVRITSDLAPKLPKIAVDAQMISQLLFNLIKNSVEAGASSVQIRTEYIKPDGAIRLMIEDNGPGLSAEKQRRLFNGRFSDKEGGHGLGLLVCKQIVDRYHGKISAENRAEGGTRFTICLPVGQRMHYSELEINRLEQLAGTSQERPADPVSDIRINAASRVALVR